MRRAAILCGLLLVSQFVLAQAEKPLTIEAIFSAGGITGRGPESIAWSPDGAKVSFVQRDDSGAHGALYYIDVASGRKAVLVTEEKLAALAPPEDKISNEREREWRQRYSVAGYQWAPDSAHLLFDAYGQLWYYSLATGTAVQLTSAANPSTDPKFSPDGSRIAYIRNHKLYVQAVNGKSEKVLTGDKDVNLREGEADWVYTEEFSVRSSYFWSADSKQIVFLQMNEQRVPTYPITDWLSVHPKVEEEKYPKAGDPNPEVRAGVVSADGGKVRWIMPGEPPQREYIPRLGWVRPGLLYLELLNRAQNKLELWFADSYNGHTRKMLTEYEPDAWVPVERHLGIYVLQSGDRFLWPSWRDGFNHLYLYRFHKDDPLSDEAKLERQITQGSFDVESIDAVDERAQAVFFTANAEDARQRQIYSTRLDAGTAMNRISRAAGTHRSIFGPNGAYYVDSFSALMTPPRLELCRLSGACEVFWQAHGMSDYDLIEPKRLELKAADGVTVLYGTLLLPPSAAGPGSIPLINNPYGGPGEQTIADSWGGSLFLFDQILARHGYAVLHVDNRGTAGRGKAFATATRRRFGEVELADQLAAMHQVLAAFPQLDPDRLGFWGWSYGGYLTLYAMTHSGAFKAGVAVAPVTDWLDYDSIYTERYMGLPNDNSNGYKSSSPVNFAGQMQGRVLEVHGTSDDNVHVQNTMQMANRFIASGVQFDLQLYPGKTHSIAGTAARTHMFYRILDHFDRWLMATPPVAAAAER
jgi:dipeptidyl-peptidase-4